MIEHIIDDIELKDIPLNNLLVSIIAYFISEYDTQAINELGYKTKDEAFKDLSAIFGKFENNYMRLRRDEFAALPDSKSKLKGLANKSPVPSVVRLAQLLKPYTYAELVNIVTALIKEQKEKNRNVAQETEADETRLLANINSSKKPIAHGAVHKGEKKPAPNPIEIEGKKYYKHSLSVSQNALSYAEFKCEIDPSHSTFLRRATGQPYTEAHHLVPLAKQESFAVSLDVEENVVSLCSNCHNQIHYGKGAEQLISILFEKRRDELNKVGIEITEEQLIDMY